MNFARRIAAVESKRWEIRENKTANILKKNVNEQSFKGTLFNIVILKPLLLEEWGTQRPTPPLACVLQRTLLNHELFTDFVHDNKTLRMLARWAVDNTSFIFFQLGLKLN